MSEVLAEIKGAVGCITLQRPKALNALSLSMIRSLTSALLAWRDDPAVQAVVLRGSNKEGPFGALCAGGDIRFFHQAILAGDPSLEDFFTEEYQLNHLIFNYPKPYIALMDGLVMGGGMGISQGATLRVVTERTRMAMPETQIGLFPDVAGGYFLSRCPGRMGEYLGLTGAHLNAHQALTARLADGWLRSEDLPGLWDRLCDGSLQTSEGIRTWMAEQLRPAMEAPQGHEDVFSPDIDAIFGLPTVIDMVQALKASNSAWAVRVLDMLLKRSPLMLHVTLEQIRRARALTLAEVLRMERDMVRQCFHWRPGTASETMEGIRALVIDKDQNPHWQPAQLEEVTPEMVQAFFESPWPAYAHPLRHLT